MTTQRSSPNITAEVFFYTGEGGARVPDDVVRVRVDPSVTVIPERAFGSKTKLQEVELCEGIQEIGQSAFINCIALKRTKIPSTVRAIHKYAFHGCNQITEVELCEGIQEIHHRAFFHCGVLKHINFPATLKRIYASAFSRTALSSIHLPNGIETICCNAFSRCNVTNFRNPPLITTIPKCMLYSCGCMFSLELSDSIRGIKTRAIAGCRSLRNIAIPPNAEIEPDVFHYCRDLEELFGSSDIEQHLKIRFIHLPIHRIIYYQSYHPSALDQLKKATNTRSSQSRSLHSKLDQTGKEPDCLGMTPLHILACSRKQDLSLYQILIEKYPENLIAKDKWGALPILYVIWGNAPNEIVQFLVQSHQSVYPDQELNWSKMVETVGRANAPLDVIQNLLDVQQASFPDQRIDWDKVLDDLAEPEDFTSEPTLRFLTNCGFSERVHAIGVKQWREDIIHEISSGGIDDRFSFDNNYEFLAAMRHVLTNHEGEYRKLKEATSILELALWKAKINEEDLTSQSEIEKRCKKKCKLDMSDFRMQCRMMCGASLVVENVLPFLLPLSE